MSRTGRPNPLDADEPRRLSATVAAMKLNYAVITSVDRDDLPDRGASHFVACIRRLRRDCPGLSIEILTPDFRGRVEQAVDILSRAPADVFNHNLETVPRLYKTARPGATTRNRCACCSATNNAARKRRPNPA